LSDLIPLEIECSISKPCFGAIGKPFCAQLSISQKKEISQNHSVTTLSCSHIPFAELPAQARVMFFLNALAALARAMICNDRRCPP
jgi:hypothetical protein